MMQIQRLHRIAAAENSTMAISPPTDIVQDVINAADPSQLEVAQAKLKAGVAVAQAQRLSGTDNGFDANMIRDHAKATTRKASADGKDIPAPYRKFEAMVLQNFIKSMMPDSEELYGKGSAGEIWKGMMAEQIGDEMSKGRGIGIAAQLASHGTTALKGSDKDKEKDSVHALSERKQMASQTVDRFEMQSLDKLLPGSTSESDDKKKTRV